MVAEKDVEWKFRSVNLQELLKAVRQDVYSQGFEIDTDKPFQINNKGIIVKARKTHHHRNPFAWEKLEYPWNEPVPYPIKNVKEKKSIVLMRHLGFISWDTMRFYARLVSIMFCILFSCAAVFFFISGGLTGLMLFLFCVIIAVFFSVLFLFLRGW